MATGLGREEASNYYVQFLPSWQAGADFCYFFHRRLAAGLNYRFSHAHGGSWVTLTPFLEDTYNYYGKMTETT